MTIVKRENKVENKADIAFSLHEDAPVEVLGGLWKKD